MEHLPEPYKSLFEAVVGDNGPVTVRKFARERADFAYVDPNNGRTLLYAAVRANRIGAVEALLKHGADPGQRFTYQSPVDGGMEMDRVALHYASTPEMVAVLLAAGTDVNVTDAIGTTPLMCAAFHGDLPVVQALLTAGANALARQDKQKVRRAPSARELAEVKLKFFQEFVAGTNQELTQSRVRCYGRIREVLLAVESANSSSF